MTRAAVAPEDDSLPPTAASFGVMPDGVGEAMRGRRFTEAQGRRAAAADRRTPTLGDAISTAAAVDVAFTSASTFGTRPKGRAVPTTMGMSRSSHPSTNGWTRKNGHAVAAASAAAAAAFTAASAAAASTAAVATLSATAAASCRRSSARAAAAAAAASATAAAASTAAASTAADETVPRRLAMEKRPRAAAAAAAAASEIADESDGVSVSAGGSGLTMWLRQVPCTVAAVVAGIAGKGEGESRLRDMARSAPAGEEPTEGDGVAPGSGAAGSLWREPQRRDRAATDASEDAEAAAGRVGGNGRATWLADVAAVARPTVRPVSTGGHRPRLAGRKSRMAQQGGVYRAGSGSGEWGKGGGGSTRIRGEPSRQTDAQGDGGGCSVRCEQALLGWAHGGEVRRWGQL